MRKCQYTKNTNKPVHTDELALIWLSKEKQLTLSPKADGIYSELSYMNNIFQCEYIDKSDIYLIFDCKKFHIRHNNTLIKRCNWIRNLHPYAKKLEILPITNFSQLVEYVKKDTLLMQSYMDETTDKIKWYPKLTFLIDSNHNFVLSVLDENIDEHLLYKTDGWIINGNNKVFKYKPKDELTIDVLYHNGQWYSKENLLHNIDDNYFNEFHNTSCHGAIDNTIWRCYWINSKWRPKEMRPDKKIPNYQSIIDNLERIHNNYTQAKDLIGMQHNYYYNHLNNVKLDISNEWKEYLQLQRNMFHVNISEILTNNNVTNILDIGCGKGEINKILNNVNNANCIYNITGIDIDPFNIYELRNKYNRTNYKWIWNDINKVDIRIDFDKKYDLIIMNNTIHTITNITQFIEHLNDIITNNSILYIHFLDKDLINTNDINFIHKQTNGMYNFHLPWKKETIMENIVSSSYLETILNNNSWCKLYEHQPIDKNNDLDNIDTSYHSYLLCHKYIVYTRK